jgi:hypothetical protein
MAAVASPSPPGGPGGEAGGVIAATCSSAHASETRALDRQARPEIFTAGAIGALARSR